MAPKKMDASTEQREKAKSILDRCRAENNGKVPLLKGEIGKNSHAERAKRMAR